MDAPLGGVTPEAVAASLRGGPWPPDLAPDERYRPLPELVADGLAARIAVRLGGAPLRVGWSAVVMGVASRLWSVLVVPAARDRVLVDVEPLVARDDAGALVLGLRATQGTPDPAPDDVAAAVARVLDPVLAQVPLAPRLVAGNVAASLHAVPRVHALPEAEPLVAHLLTAYPGELEERPDGAVRRRTCCLFYEVPGAGLCGDCVFDVAPGA